MILHSLVVAAALFLAFILPIMLFSRWVPGFRELLSTFLGIFALGLLDGGAVYTRWIKYLREKWSGTKLEITADLLVLRDALGIRWEIDLAAIDYLALVSIRHQPVGYRRNLLLVQSRSETIRIAIRSYWPMNDRLAQEPIELVGHPTPHTVLVPDVFKPPLALVAVELAILAGLKPAESTTGCPEDFKPLRIWRRPGCVEQFCLDDDVLKRYRSLVMRCSYCRYRLPFPRFYHWSKKAICRRCGSELQVCPPVIPIVIGAILVAMPLAILIRESLIILGWTFSINYFSFGLLLAGILIWMSLTLRFSLHKASGTLCVACGYDLRGSPAARCPECGMQNLTPTPDPSLKNNAR